MEIIQPMPSAGMYGNHASSATVFTVSAVKMAIFKENNFSMIDHGFHQHTVFIQYSRNSFQIDGVGHILKASNVVVVQFLLL